MPSALQDSTAINGLCALGERLSTFACICGLKNTGIAASGRPLGD
jgi:hypothetical protein